MEGARTAGLSEAIPTRHLIKYIKLNWLFGLPVIIKLHNAESGVAITLVVVALA